MPKMYKMEKICAGYAPSFGPSAPCGVFIETLEWEARPGEPEPSQKTHGMCGECYEKQMKEFQVMEGSKL